MDDAHAAVNQVQRQAEQLHDEYLQSAKQVRGQLGDASGIAPDEPGLLESMNAALDAAQQWIEEHAELVEFIANVMATIAAVAGILAFIPPLSVVMTPIALTAGFISFAAEGALLWAGTENASWSDFALAGAGFVCALSAFKAGRGIVRASAQPFRGSSGCSFSPACWTLGRTGGNGWARSGSADWPPGSPRSRCAVRRGPTWASPRNEEIDEMWKIWHGWIQRDIVPYYDFEVDGFTAPNGSPSVAWRIWPDGDESNARKPLPPEQASTDEQYRCRLTYESTLRLIRPWLGARGGNFIAFIGAAVGVVLTIVFAVSAASSDPAPWAGVQALAFAAFTLVMLAFPAYALKRDIPRLRHLVRMINRWEVSVSSSTMPKPPLSTPSFWIHGSRATRLETCASRRSPSSTPSGAS